MPKVLVTGAILQCPHRGQVTLLPSAGDPTLTVGGSGVVLLGSEAGLSFAMGTPPCMYATPNGPSPCTTGPVVAGMSTVLSVNGRPALLDTATGLVINPQFPPTPWTVTFAGQVLLDVEG